MRLMDVWGIGAAAVLLGACGGGGDSSDAGQPDAGAAPEGPGLRAVDFFGGPAQMQVAGAAADADDNLYLAGHVAGEYQFGDLPPGDAGSFGAGYVLALSPERAARWADLVGDVLAVAADSSGVVTSDGHDVVQHDAAGTRGWTVRVSGAIAYAVAAVPGGGWVLGGRITTSTATVGEMPIGGEGSPFAARVEADGSVAWAVSIDGIGAVTAIAAASGEEVIVAGYGRQGAAAAPAAGAFLARLGAAGERLWGRTFPAAGDPCECSVHLALDGDGGAVLVGPTRSELDFGTAQVAETDLFAAAFDPGGETRWARAVVPGRPGGSTDAVAVSASGEILVGGLLGGPIEFAGGVLGRDNSGAVGFFLALGGDGAERWGRVLVAESLAQVHAVALVGARGADDAVLVAGHVGQCPATFDLGAEPVSCTDGIDAFVAAYGP
jgi:hypothetical protein